MQLFPTQFFSEPTSSVKTNTSKASALGSSFENLLGNLSNSSATATTASHSIKSARALLLNGSDLESSIKREKLLTDQSKDSTLSSSRNGNVDIHTLHGLKSKLSAIGVEDSTLDELETAAGQGKLTWNSLLHTLNKDANFSGKDGSAIRLDDTTRNNTDVLLQKLGFSSDETNKLISDLENGDLSKTWNTVLEKINGLSKDAKIGISQDELGSLGKAMQLDTDGISRMQKLFAGQSEAQADANTLKDLLAEISNSVASKKSAADARFVSMKEALAPAMDKASAQNAGLAASDVHASKNSAASNMLIKDGMTADANGFAHAAAASSDHENTNLEGKSKDEAEALILKGEMQAAEQQHTANAHKKQQSDLGFSDKNKNSSSDNSQKDTKDSGLHSLLQRLEFHVAQQQGPTGSEHTETAKNAMNMAKNADQRIFEQVESGMLKTMQDGAKQLTLQLTPEDLGKLTIILSVKNNEVNAVIRPESAEAAKAINDQMHQLKASLENQGLKVDSIEVQTGLQNNLANSNWQGSAEHNAQQELRQNFLNNLRLQRTLNGATDLAQEMQPTMETERSSTRQGLDIIA